ncbi:hypothetical protein R1flu_019779 [Riccia fluitans]|uniref:RING-type E3 ubiquitin transferase n=1 Tax=Riccia fluitans TaxID=41844 RepID=A0ABD1ZLT3_9MARC
MEDSSDAGRGVVPLVSSSSRHGSCWPSSDMHYPLSNNNYASGSGSNIGSRLSSRMDEAKESWQGGRVYGQDNNGKGPAVQKSSQMSPKLASSRSSGVRRSQRSHDEATAHGQWNNALHNCSGSSDEPVPGNMESDSNVGIGLNTRMGLSEVPSLLGQGRASVGQDFSLRSGIPSGRNSDTFFSGDSSMMGAEINHPGRGSGLVGDRLGSIRGSGSSGLSVTNNRSSLLGSNVTYRSNSRRSILDEGRIGNSQGLAITSSLLGERLRNEGEGLHDENILSDPFMAGGRMSGGEAPSSSNESAFPVGAVSLDRENQSLKGLVLGNSMSNNTSSSYKSGINSSRGSACKRKSCTPGLLGSSCRSASPHASTSREGYGGTRTTGGSSSGRRSSGNLGCASASSVVASTSALTAGGRCAEISVSTNPLEEPRPRKISTSRDLESGLGRAGKSSFVACSSSSSGNGSRSLRSGSAGGNLEQTSLPSQPPFTRAVRRAIPALQPDSWCSRRGVSLADCPTDTDFSTAGGSSLGRSSEQLLTATGVRRSGSPLVTGSSRTSNTASPRRSDSHTGTTTSVTERLSHRYVGSSSRSSLTAGSSNQASFGGIGSESRLRFRSSSGDGSSSPANTAVQSQGGQNSNQQGITNGGQTSMPSPSRLPPHPPVVRSRHSHMLNAPMPPSSSSGPAPSRIPPSPPNLSSPLSTAFDILPSGTNILQSSFLPRTTSFREGRSERGLASAAESLFGMPFRGLQSPGDGEHQPRLIAEGLAEILLALERVERDEDLTYEQLLMLEATLLFGGMGLHDQHSDLRLDVDNMSYEELLALEERIGNVSTGLNPETVNKRLERSKYSTRSVAVSSCSQESDIKCSICQEEYVDGDELGKIDCGHGYHVACIKQWLVQKNQCPICKAAALS